jgi:hypothetical protein
VLTPVGAGVTLTSLPTTPGSTYLVHWDGTFSSTNDNATDVSVQLGSMADTFRQLSLAGASAPGDSGGLSTHTIFLAAGATIDVMLGVFGNPANVGPWDFTLLQLS